ncbi:MAG: trigger factor [Chloroflexi bacterium RBG_13_56_8]|nr:MAG: trigger factor [Chloroflexi bacterium RBG_13_56_8]
MKVTTETVGTREVELTIEPDAARMQREMHRAARQASSWRPVPGFRPGKAPYNMVERLVGRDVLLHQAIEQMASDLYREAVTEAKIEPFEQGQMDIASEEPVVLKVKVPLMPIVDLGDYHSLHIDPEPEVVVSEEQINEEIERTRREHAEYEPVQRPLDMGDQIVAVVKEMSADQPIVNQQEMTFEVHDQMQPPGFAEALLGMHAGETRTFSLTYPDDFGNEDLAGKRVDFEVTVNTIRGARLPEVDDDLAKMAGDYETLGELREDLAARLKERLENEARQRESEAALNALIEQAEIEYPPAALDREIDASIENQKTQVQRMGLDYENYLRMMGLTEVELREQARPTAERRLVRRLVVTKFAQVEELSVDETEMAAQIASIMERYGDRAEEIGEQLRDGRVMLSMYGDILGQKAVERLTAMLTGRLEEEEPTAEDSKDGESEEGAELEAVENTPSDEVAESAAES